MSLDFLDAAELRIDVERDRFGRPKIQPPGGGKPTAYTRCTTFIKCVEDTTTLEKWGRRMVLVGAASDPSLIERAAGTSDRGELDALAETALVAAKAHEKRDKGTHLHLLSEMVDRGQPLPDDTSTHDRADMLAYWRATHPLHVTHIETLTVLDDWKVAGTPDRLIEYGGRTYIADLKTGRVDFGALKMAMQLAIYSRSVLYDHQTQTRTPLPDVDQDRAVIIHLPAGSGSCSLLWLDIAAGWEAVKVARQVRQVRNVRNVLSPFEVAS